MRKRCNRKHYKLCNPISMALMGASITPEKDLNSLRLRELSAIESFRTGSAEKDDWMVLADMVNIAETLGRQGIGVEVVEASERAQEALRAAHRRHTETGRLGVTGPELQALRDAYALHDLQRLSIARSVYEQAISKTFNRIRSADPSVKVCV